MPEAKLRVVAPDVGGGFGSKLEAYPEDAICLTIAKVLGRPVKWIEERSEGYVATLHGREMYQRIELASTKDGILKAVRVKLWASMGAHMRIITPGIPMLGAWLYAGCYDVEAYDFEYTNVFTNNTFTDAYRGAGRPEATYAIERSMDALARRLGMDPVELRRKNFIPNDKFPNYTIASGLTIDSANYQRHAREVPRRPRLRGVPGRAEGPPRRAARPRCSGSGSRPGWRCAASPRRGCSPPSSTSPAAGTPPRWSSCRPAPSGC